MLTLLLLILTVGIILGIIVVPAAIRAKRCRPTVPVHKSATKQLPTGPYRTLAEQEGQAEEAEWKDVKAFAQWKPEPEDFQSLLTAAEAADRYRQKEEESTKDLAKLFKSKVEPKVEEAIEELKHEAFCYPLSEVEIKVLGEYVKKLGYQVVRTDEGSMRIKF